MRIQAIETVHLLHRYQTPFVYGGGVCTGRLTSLVIVQTDTPHSGLGAVYSHPALVEIVIKQQLEPMLLGQDPRLVEEHWRTMYGLTRWYGRKGAAMSAIGGIDTALWDLRAKAAGKPLRKLFNPSARDTCPVYASGLLWKDSVAELATEASGYLEQGYRRMKMRLARSDEYDVAALRAVRTAIGPHNDLMIDAVMRYDLPTAARMAKVMADHGVLWFEEPFAPENIDGYLALSPTARSLGLRVSTGENEFGVQGFAEWINRGAVDIVQPDVSRCGGISEALTIAKMAHKAGMGLAPHTWSDAVAMIANAQVVAAMPNGITVESDRTGNPFIDELLVDPIHVVDGQLQLSDRPGLGIEWREDTIRRCRLADPFNVPDGNYSDFAFGQGQFKLNDNERSNP
jgi:L-alanine-DL-glutamate epimerase-like enolase superfamily enzyme